MRNQLFYANIATLLPHPVHIGAIDAGSNALRVVVAEVTPGAEAKQIEGYRVPVRLGHGAFTVGELDIHTIDAAVEAFRGFHALFDKYGVEHYRAVTTSAVRESRNRDVLLHRVFAEAGIELEMITGDEEARLVRKAVRNAFRGKQSPVTVLDLGGGSLEVNVLNVTRWRAASLPIGTVRLMETFGLTGAIGEEEARMVRRYVKTLIQVFAPDRAGKSFAPAAACGGNAERYAKLLGSEQDGMMSFEVKELERILPEILASDVPTRIQRFGVRRDRAEVMGVAGLVLATCARELGLESIQVPGVGIRDAVAFEVGATLPERREDVTNSRAKALITAARMFAARLGHDLTHGERVRHLTMQLFDQLQPVHKLAPAQRTVLELAALLHDIGEVIHGQGHHKHGEYVIRWGRIAGLESPQREIIAALVRSHRRSAPNAHKHLAYGELTAPDRKIVRKMLGLLRIADSLDTSHRQRVIAVQAVVKKRTIDLRLTIEGDADVDPAVFLRKADLFEREFRRTVTCTVLM
jgi:exopolyphosphatase/guanosine-5'-triphosphate,3'-diphosphate pyrophosphatase